MNEKYCIAKGLNITANIYIYILCWGRKLGADESLFARLDTPDATVSLTHQYRMNKTIMKLANDLTYHGALKCANDDIANATFSAKTTTKIKWIQRILSSHIDQSVIFLNTGSVAKINNEIVDKLLGYECQNAILSPTKVRSTRTYTNYCEVAIILTIVKELKAMGIASKMIGIIAPYAFQVDLLKKTVAKHFDSEIEVNTVDQYQGRDKEVSTFSMNTLFPSHIISNGTVFIYTNSDGIHRL